jgi:hypothetical protein
MKIAILNLTLQRDIWILCPFTFGCKNKESQTAGVEREKGEKQQQGVYVTKQVTGKSN